MAKIGQGWHWKAHKRIQRVPDEIAGEVASMEPSVREMHYCLRADRWLLKRRVIEYQDAFRDGEIRRVDLGWRRYGRVKEGADDSIIVAQLESKGFRIERR